MMTKSEQRKMRKLEIDNEMYQRAFNRHMDVYREISLENIQMRARLAHLEGVLLELGKEIQEVNFTCNL